MFSERLQILVSPDQRRRLEEEARRTGSSVGAIVRGAIDEQIGVAAVEVRLQAAEAIAALRGRHLSLAELDALIDDERLANAAGD